MQANRRFSKSATGPCPLRPRPHEHRSAQYSDRQNDRQRDYHDLHRTHSKGYAGLPPPHTSENVRLSLIAETSTGMRLMQRGRPDEKLVTGRSNGGAYTTVYATARTAEWRNCE